jgi:hypothetical protein
MTRRRSGGKNSKGRVPSHRAARFVVCVKSKGYPLSFEVGKVYRALRDRDAEQHQMRRVVDDSGEDYLYHRDRFIELRLPPTARRALSSLLA